MRKPFRPWKTTSAYTPSTVPGYVLTGGSFQLQMRISFPFLPGNYLRMFLLIMRTCSFYLLYVGDTYARLVYTRYKNIFRMIAALIVFHTANGEKKI